MSVLTAFSDTCLDGGLLFCRKFFLTDDSLAQRSNSICVHRLLEHGDDSIKLGFVCVFLGLCAQAFCNPQIEASHGFRIFRADRGLPVRGTNEVPDNLARLWVHRIGGDTHSLLLPHIKFQEERGIHALLGTYQVLPDKLSKKIPFPFQTLILGFQTRQVHRMGSGFIYRLYTQQFKELLLIKQG